MRSTWTWDDRALRRDLARLLTTLRAVGELEPGGDVHRLVRRRALHSAAGFLAAVLGPRVIADSGHATSYSFSDTLGRSPWLVGGPDEELLLDRRRRAATVPDDPVRRASTSPLRRALRLVDWLRTRWPPSGDQDAGPSPVQDRGGRPVGDAGGGRGVRVVGSRPGAHAGES